MKLKFLFIFPLMTCLALCACGSNQSTSDSQAEGVEVQAGSVHGSGVTDVIHAGQYTYVEVKRDGETLWAAAPQFEVEVGDEVVLPQDMMAMQNWHSKTLDRTWDVVYFASSITKVGGNTTEAKKDPGSNGDLADALDFSGITTPKGGKTVASLYAEKESLSGKAVLVRGMVVKVTKNVMSKNWVHLQDGSGESGTNDLTVTTSTLPNVGDMVLVRGELHTDIDFGAGYFFSIIVEDGEITIE